MKEYLVIRNGHVVYRPGYNTDLEARIMARRVSGDHPRAIIQVVEIIDSYRGGQQHGIQIVEDRNETA